MGHRFKHPLLRKVGNVGSRQMPCYCDAYPYPHNSMYAARCPNAFMDAPYAIQRIIKYGILDGLEVAPTIEWAMSISDAFGCIDLLTRDNPDALYVIACGNRLIYVPKNL